MSNTFKIERQLALAPDTINKDVGYFEDVFLIQKAIRYGVKEKKYIKTSVKYYYSDLGLRNAWLGFRQLGENNLMENVLYNDQIRREIDIDVGVIEYNTKVPAQKQKQLEVDFMVNQGSHRFYLQSALAMLLPDISSPITCLKQLLIFLTELFLSVIIVDMATILFLTTPSETNVKSKVNPYFTKLDRLDAGTEKRVRVYEIIFRTKKSCPLSEPPDLHDLPA